MTRRRIFVSSVQKELAAERRAVKEFVANDPLLRRFFDAFLFEDVPAADRRADELYLHEVDACDIYVGLFGDDYGYEDADGVSPTEREFDRATSGARERLIFVRGDGAARHPKQRHLVDRAASQLVRRRFNTIPELTSALYASLVDYLARVGLLTTRPFDATASDTTALDDLSSEKLDRFLSLAQRNRGYALGPGTPMADALVHLNLLDRDRPTNAAVLLFGKAPQRQLPTSEVKCLHFHGAEVRKPIPSYQIYKGTVFELVDQAIDFVMSKIARRVGTRAQGPAAPVEYELPRDAVAEAIVNAVAHRDYASNASVQVMLFADRLEVWNPGELPPSLTPELLRVTHASVPRNPLLADPLFLARYIEKVGTGTVDMIAWCADAGLAPPEFRQSGGQFIQLLWRDWLTETVVASLGLRDRQKVVLPTLRFERRITNGRYQELTGMARSSAKRDLEDLVSKGILVPVGAGRSAAYVVPKKRSGNGPNGPRGAEPGNGPQMAQTGRDPEEPDPG